MPAKDRSLHDTPTSLSNPLAVVVAYAVSQGIPFERVADVTGLTLTDLFEAESQQPEAYLPTVMRLIDDTFPDRVASLDMASSAPLSFFGIIAHAAGYAEDLRSAIQVFIHYRTVFSTRLQLTLVEDGEEARFEMHHPMDAADGGYGAELGMAMGYRFFREVLGVESGVRRIDFTHSPFGPLSVYRDFFGSPVLFGQSRNACVIDRGLMDHPNPKRNAALCLSIQRHLDVVTQHLRRSEDTQEFAEIRVAIAQNAKHREYGAEALARKLGMSLRTLQRSVRKHSVSVRQLLDQAREANARQFLSDDSMSIEEVSFFLGYSTESAFRRAFKRWTGESPAQFRRGLA